MPEVLVESWYRVSFYSVLLDSIVCVYLLEMWPVALCVARVDSFCLFRDRGEGFYLCRFYAWYGVVVESMISCIILYILLDTIVCVYLPEVGSMHRRSLTDHSASLPSKRRPWISSCLIFMCQWVRFYSFDGVLVEFMIKCIILFCTFRDHSSCLSSGGGFYTPEVVDS